RIVMVVKVGETRVITAADVDQSHRGIKHLRVTWHPSQNRSARFGDEHRNREEVVFVCATGMGHYLLNHREKLSEIRPEATWIVSPPKSGESERMQAPFPIPSESSPPRVLAEPEIGLGDSDERWDEPVAPRG